MIYFIKNTDQPDANNVHLIHWNGNINTSEIKEDDQDGKMTEEGVQDLQRTVQ